jgi:hypothetical protein
MEHSSAHLHLAKVEQSSTLAYSEGRIQILNALLYSFSFEALLQEAPSSLYMVASPK